MSTFSDILSDVYTLTNRSDLIGESKLGIRAATLKLHLVEFWREDRIEEEIAVTTAESQFSIAITAGAGEPFSYLPRPNNIIFKKTTADVIFEEINPKQLLDGFGFKRFNVYYQAGNTYKFLTDTADTAIFCQYYRFPVATETGYDSWIAVRYPSYIATEAALFVASAIGDEKLEARMQNLSAINLAQLNINHLDSN